MDKFHDLIGIFKLLITAFIILILDHLLEVLDLKVMSAMAFHQVDDFRFFRAFQPDFRFRADGRRAVNDDISVVALQLTDIFTCGILAADTARQKTIIIKNKNTL